MSDEEIGQHIWVETGENLTRETFAKYKPSGGLIISPPSYSEESVKNLIADPMVMVASDGMWLTNGKAHPRTWGTYARVLGRYVREQNALGLMQALEKMTVLPADRLSQRVPRMKKKGRIQVGADADIVVFDPDTVIDQATYHEPVQYSTGIDHVVEWRYYTSRRPVQRQRCAWKAHPDWHAMTCPFQVNRPTTQQL